MRYLSPVGAGTPPSGSMVTVGQHEKDQLLGALGPMKSDIVEKP